MSNDRRAEHGIVIESTGLQVLRLRAPARWRGRLRPCLLASCAPSGEQLLARAEQQLASGEYPRRDDRPQELPGARIRTMRGREPGSAS